jgi:hypothetical protein
MKQLYFVDRNLIIKMIATVGVLYALAEATKFL